MSGGKRRRWLWWAIGLPCVIGLLGFGALLFMDRRIEAGIREEEGLLLAMGIDVREYVPEMDAAKDYAKISYHLPRIDSKEDIRAFLDRMEEAAKKPLASTVDPETRIALQRAYFKVLELRDMEALRQAFGLDVAIRAQLLAAGDQDVQLPLELPNGASVQFSRYDPEIRTWLRKTLESDGLKRLVQGKYTGIGRKALRLNKEHRYPSLNQPWWRKALESQTSFRRAAHLTILRQLRAAAMLALQMRPLDGLALEGRNSISTSLKKEGSMQAESASDRILGGFRGPEPQTFMLYRAWLIQLDLCDSYENGKPLKPTWSQRYCYDPLTGLPIVVAATKKDLTLSTSAPGRPTWSVKFEW